MQALWRQCVKCYTNFYNSLGEVDHACIEHRTTYCIPFDENINIQMSHVFFKYEKYWDGKKYDSLDKGWKKNPNQIAI